MKKVTLKKLYKMHPYETVSVVQAAKLLNMGYSSLSDIVGRGRYFIEKAPEGAGYTAGVIRDCLENGVTRISDGKRGWFVTRTKKAIFELQKPQHLIELSTPVQASLTLELNNKAIGTPLTVGKPAPMDFNNLIVIDPISRQTWPFEEVMFKVIERAMDT